MCISMYAYVHVCTMCFMIAMVALYYVYIQVPHAHDCTYILQLPCLVSRGDSKMVQLDGIVAMLWLDNRVVTVLSTNAQPHERDVVQRRQHDRSRVDVGCPTAVALY